MAMSFGQDKADGHSHGPLGHGGIHRMGGHGSNKSNGPKANPFTQGSEAGHTMANSHGGGMPMGC
jgi:hypothetical protein